jgi:deoxyribonuclease-1-like protein
MFLLLLVILLLVYVFVYTENKHAIRQNNTSTDTRPKIHFTKNQTTPTNTQSLRLCSWNIQNFGESKANNPIVMTEIAQALSTCDITAIQEVSNIGEKIDLGCPSNQNTCPNTKKCGMIQQTLTQYLNSHYNKQYGYIFSPQIRDERYLFIYDSNKLMLLNHFLMSDNDQLPLCEPTKDNNGLMIRQPFLAVFADKQGNTSFSLLTAHTSPTINTKELEGLAQFYQTSQQQNPNVILLGDLNADCDYLKDNTQILLRQPTYVWAIPNGVDTTTKDTTCTYDRIIFNNQSKNLYTGRYGINNDISINASDHKLVWVDLTLN